MGRGGSRMQAHALGMLPHPQPWDNLAALPLPPPRESCTPRKEPRGSHASRRGRGGKLWRRSGGAGSRGCPRPGSGTRRGRRRSACLQPYLQHPGGHHPAHVGLNVLLHALEVGALGQVALLDGQQVLQHAVVVEQVGVRHGPADRLHLAAQQLHGQLATRSCPCDLRTGKVGGFLGGGRGEDSPYLLPLAK